MKFTTDEEKQIWMATYSSAFDQYDGNKEYPEITKLKNDLQRNRFRYATYMADSAVRIFSKSSLYFEK